MNCSASNFRALHAACVAAAVVALAVTAHAQPSDARIKEILTQRIELDKLAVDNKLFAQATGQGEFELFGKSEDTFFARVTPLEIVFEEVKEGKAMRFSITQGGSTRQAARVE